MYFVVLIGFTLFPIVIPPASEPYQMNFVNWDITDMFNYGSWQSMIVNVGGNIMMFIPLLPLIELEKLPKRISAGSAFLISIGVSLSIELMQYLENIAAISDLPIRMTDISDIILNCIGGIIGHIMFNMWRNKFYNSRNA